MGVSWNIEWGVFWNRKTNRKFLGSKKWELFESKKLGTF
jgi:hypothetical protein